MTEKRALIVAGGTGGHMFPARAAAEALVERGWTVRLVTDARGSRHASGFPGEAPEIIEAATPFVKNPVTLVKNLAKLARGTGAARRLVKRFDPDVVAGFGGYVAFPALTAARLAGVPIVLHEQNAVLGRVNRLFAGSAAAVASGFDRLDRAPKRAPHVVTGNPVRAAVLAAREAPYAPPEDDGEIRLLVIGGSLGARILSVGVPEAVAALPEDLRTRLKIVQQTRSESLDAARRIYAEAGVSASCEPFFDDMGARYAAAHLVIARAGASTVAELAAIGRPAVLVPLAIAMDDHQSANAAALAEPGGAVVIDEHAFDASALSARLETLLRDGKSLGERAAAARAAGRPDAHDALADLVESAAKER